MPPTLLCYAEAQFITYPWPAQVHESLTTIAWDAPRAIDAEKVSAVSAALVADQGKMPTDTDPYFFGKEVCCIPALYCFSAVPT